MRPPSCWDQCRLIFVGNGKERDVRKPGIQSRANEDQDSRCQENNSIVLTESACTAGKHEGSKGIDDVGQGI